jgi:hypothetical protein
MSDITVTIQLSPVIARAVADFTMAVDDLARAVRDLIERYPNVGLRLPETPSSAAAPATAQAEPAGDPQAFLDISSQTAQPADVLNEPVAPAAASSGGGIVWTAERDAYVTETMDTEKPRGEILEAVNRLPGPAVASLGAIYQRINVLRRRFAQPQPSPSHIDADVEQIRSWAAQRGLTYQAGDLGLINDKRKALSLPPFQLVRRARAA